MTTIESGLTFEANKSSITLSMRITIVLAILTLSLALIDPCGIVFAATSTGSADINLNDLGSLDSAGAVDIGYSLIAPNSPLYFLKAIREKIETQLASSREAKAITRIEFAQRRLREVNALVKNQRSDFIPPTLERYKEYLQEAGGLALYDEDLSVRVGEAVSRHLDVLQRVYDQVGNPRAKAAIRAAIEKAEEHNRILIGKLDLTHQQQLIGKVAVRQALVCRFFQREASSSALNDTEREFMKQKVGLCKDSVNKNLKDELMDIKQKKMGPKLEGKKPSSSPATQ